MSEYIIAEIRRIAAEIGRPPGAWLFETETRIRQCHWRGRYWPRWSDALRDAGFEPNAPHRRPDPDAVLEQLAGVVRRFRRMPTVAELKIYRRAFPAAPTPNALWRAFGAQPAVVARLREWAQARPEFADVAAVLPQAEEARGGGETVTA